MRCWGVVAKMGHYQLHDIYENLSTVTQGFPCLYHPWPATVPLATYMQVKYRIYVGWRFSPSNARCLVGEFEHSSHLKTLALRLWRKMIYCEAVSVSTGSKQTSDPAPPSRSDAENILPVLNPDILPSLARSKWRKCYSECTDAPKARVPDRCKKVVLQNFGRRLQASHHISKWWWRSPDQRAPSHQGWMQHIWFVMRWHALIHTLRTFFEISACCAYNLMAHWYTSFAILILL